jgi:hypothetical protein
MNARTHALSREEQVRRVKRLEYATVGYNILEGLASIGAGMVAGSIALVGFEFDSTIEVISGAALPWRLHSDTDDARRERVAHRDDSP